MELTVTKEQINEKIAEKEQAINQILKTIIGLERQIVEWNQSKEIIEVEKTLLIDYSKKIGGDI